MRKKLIFLLLLISAFIFLVGCRSTDYKKAVQLQSLKDYTSAAELYKNLNDYKDSNQRLTDCQTMITAIAEYNIARADAERKNEELSTAISEAEKLLTNEDEALDDTLFPTLETAISNAKSNEVALKNMPELADDIISATKELNSVDYDELISSITKQSDLLNTSIAQYKLVNYPTEAYIISCLKKVPNVVDISAATEDNDPNGHLNKAGSYTAQVYFSSDLVDQNSVYGKTIIEKGTDCGGSIEVYKTLEDAERRLTYLASFDGSAFSSGSHTIIGTVIVRTSDMLKASQQQELEANIIKSLITLPN